MKGPRVVHTGVSANDLKLNNNTLRGAHIQQPDPFWKDLSILLTKVLVGVFVGTFIGFSWGDF